MTEFIRTCFARLAMLGIYALVYGGTILIGIIAVKILAAVLVGISNPIPFSEQF